MWSGDEARQPQLVLGLCTLISSQQPHDIEHPVPFFPEAAAAESTTATETGGGGGEGGGEGEGRKVTGGAGIPGFSITSIRFASC